MAITFLEPGGDATFIVNDINNGGFWSNVISNFPTIVTDFKHGNHLKSIRFQPNVVVEIQKSNVLNDSGTRISYYIYIVALPSSTATISRTTINNHRIRITSSGTLQLWNDTAQIGSNGPVLSTGQWYRICLTYTIASTTVNSFFVFLNGIKVISATNVTLNSTGQTALIIGIEDGNSILDTRFSDIYVDNSSSLTDPGDVWVTAKRPNANGTLNEFTTIIGAGGGSGYGSGHSPQVNERALSTTNGWSVINAGSIKTEEYNIEDQGTGDFSIINTKIVGYVGWVYASSVTSETAKIRVANSDTNISLTATNAMFTAVGSTAVYPTGGTDIGVVTDTTVTTVGLYECGIMVAFIPTNGKGFIQNSLRPRVFKPGLGR